MARRALIVIGIVLSTLFVSSCSVLQPHLALLRGNYSYGQGEFQQATMSYLRALEEQEYASWLEYNLGNVYYALGELSAAFEMWEAAGESSDQELLFNVSFNRGVAYYELGEYQKAYDQFVYALELKSSSVAAKRNLELSLRKLRAGNTVQQVQQSAEAEPQQDTQAEALRILDYIRRKEEQRWFAADREEPEEAPRDW